MSDLTRITVNLTRRSVDALEQVSESTQATQTATVNRALLVYDIVLKLMERGGGRIKVEHADGTRETVTIL